MEQQLKQRLVGVAVIFSLAIIFLPMLLDGSGQRPQHLKISIPPPPPITSYIIVADKVVQLKKDVEKIHRFTPTVVDEISDPPDTKQQVATIKDTVEPSQKKKVVTSTTVSKPVVEKQKSIPVAKVSKQPVKEIPGKKQSGGDSWVIQVGSFSEKNKAYKQRDKLRNSALSAVFIEKFKHDGMISYRVRMGPFISRDKARVIGNKVRAKYNIKGLVMRYEK